MNYTYFCELFKTYTGETFVNYLKKLRVEKAIELLLDNPNHKIYEVANMVGYKDAKQFTKTFRKITGISPIEYKNKYSH
ncbi:helix-turn-helix domain-containing protein [Clostridium sp.]|uniref:helix-turn-helix domain-containing protein n=1 Tax=Clostridium sp. TaxID=1506 RepID=UPI003D6CADA0